MLLLALSYIFLSKYEFQKSVCIFLICLYRGSDALSDVFQGLFQQNARLDIAGKSLFEKLYCDFDIWNWFVYNQ